MHILLFLSDLAEILHLFYLYFASTIHLLYLYKQEEGVVLPLR